jgi:hypothetical protein
MNFVLDALLSPSCAIDTADFDSANAMLFEDLSNLVRSLWFWEREKAKENLE